MNDMGDEKRAWTLNSLIEAMLEAMPNASVSVINKLAPKPLIFIDSGMYLGDSTEDGTDHHLHDLEPELSLPLIDDGGPTPEDMGLVLAEDGDDALHQWIKNAVAASIPTDNIDTPQEERAHVTTTAESEAQRAKQAYGMGLISEEEYDRKIEVIWKLKKLFKGKHVEDDEYRHALRQSGFYLPIEIPDADEPDPLDN